MEHSAITRLLGLGALLLVAAPGVGQQEDAPYFSLSASKTFASNTSASISVSAWHVNALEFRVYRVNDPVQFFEQLENPRRFGGSTPPPPQEKTLIEKVRSWKRRLHAGIRREMRAQFTEPPSAHLPVAFANNTAGRPQTKEIRYAEAPVLNSQQLVLTFQQPVQGSDRWATQTVDIGVREKGVYMVEAVQGGLHAYTILMVSDLVMTTKTARGRVLNFVADRATGQPIAGAEVWMLSPGQKRVSVKTSADGIAELPLTTQKTEDVRIVAKMGNDVGSTALASYAFGANEDRWVGYLYTDRPVYRPGHTVQFKGIFRTRTPDGYKTPNAKTVMVTIQDSSGKNIFQKQLPLNANGTVRDKLVLPNEASLGYYSIEVRAGDAYLNGNFEVEEYKKPEYEVRVSANQPRLIQGSANRMVIDAQYYFGEPVSGAAVKYSLYRDRYWFPLWYDPDEEIEQGESDGDYGGEEISQGEGTLDEAGKLTVNVPTEVADSSVDFRYRLEARVTDPARREITGSGTFLATYGSFVVNVEPDRYFYAPRSKATFAVEARNYESQPVATPVRVELIRWNWRATEKNVVVATAASSTGANGTGRAELTIPAEGGSYRVRISARTPEGRTVEQYSSVWVSGRAGEDDVFSSSEESLQIVPDKKTYRPGDTARFLVASGVPNTPVLVSVEGRDLRMHQVLRSDGPTVTFELPVTLRDEPGLYVTAQFVRDGTIHRGTKYVRVPAEEHALHIALATDKPQYRPGDTAVYSLEVTDNLGKPVPHAELSLGVVDEAIYAIRRDTTQDPLQYFFGREYNSVFTEDSLNYYFSGEAGKRRMQLAQMRSPTKLAQLKPERLVLPKVRKVFPDTAFWAPDLVTDERGRAQARVELPDSLTTWRATTRGVTQDTKVGAAVVKNITRKNVILRLGVPRFMVRGDEVTISTLVHNYLETAKDAKVSLQVSGLEVIDGATRTVSVAAKGEVRVDWRVRATTIGTAKITGQALTNEESDAVEIEIPVNAPGVPLSQSKGGSITAGASAVVDLAFPAQAEAGSRKLSIRVSPSIAGALFSAVEYLTTFPYGCVEQTMSSFLPNIIVQKTVRDLGLNADLDQAQVRQKIADGLDRLYAFQHEDGGWGWWETDESHAFMTAYVAAGLQQARDAGVPVRDDVIERGQKWVEQTLRNSPKLAADLRAYMLFSIGTRADAAAVAGVYGSRAQMSPYGLALLGLAFEQLKDGRVAEIASTLEKSVEQDAEQAWWKASRDEMLDFSTDATPEATAHVVRFLSHQRPQSPLLPKAALWLMNHRNEGYWWESTKQTAMVIYGLTDYLKLTNELNPDLTVNVLVNGKQVLSKHFTQAGVGDPDLVLKESELQAGANHIQVTTSGKGRLYYSGQAGYSSSEEKMERTGTVSLNMLREYFRLVPTQANGRIVYDTVPLTGPVASGDTLAVRLTVTGSEWRYLLIEDPIPAGTEFIERDQSFELRNRPPWWGYFFTRREMHDDRMAIFETYFPKGQQDYFYLLKVVNPGKFHTSPARVMPMYQSGVMATTGARDLEAR
ncbi:MAG: MG2 domain-containing protein [Bryobacteraceae bacterium]